MKRKHSLIFVLFCLSTPSFAQKSHAEKQFSRKPLWIDMIKDSSVNFFEAENAYKTYWEHHELPKEEDGEGSAKEAEKRMSRRELKKERAVTELNLEMKRYLQWRESVLPWVKDNGQIRTPAERSAIWKTQAQHPVK